MPDAILITIVLLVASGAGACSRTSRRQLPERLVRCLLPAASAAAVVAVIGAVVGAFANTWTGIRIAPARALAEGFALYPSATSGAVLGNVYGPVNSLLLVPAAVVCDSVATIVVLASSTFLVMTLAPLALAAAAARTPARASRTTALACMLAVLFAVTRTKGLHMMVLSVHADAPAIGLGLLSCVLLGSGRTGHSWAAALLAVLATGSKQVEIALLPCQLLWLWARHDAGAALRHGLRLAVLGVVVSAATAAAFGLSATAFNLVTVVGSHPWVAADGFVGQTLVSCLTQGHLFGLVILAAALIAARAQPPSSWREAVTAFACQPWSLPAVAALALLPSSVLGRIKIGGDDNAFHSLYYLAAAAAVAAMCLGGERASPRSRQLTAATLAGLLAAFVIDQAVGLPRLAAGAEVVRAGRDPLATAVHVARAHPGEVYFPWFPLASLLTTGEATHAEYGVWDRELAGYPLSSEHVLAHVPSSTRFIAYHFDCMSFLYQYFEGTVPAYKAASFYMARRYFPAFSERVELADLPGWVVFARPLPDRPPG